MSQEESNQDQENPPISDQSTQNPAKNITISTQPNNNTESVSSPVHNISSVFSGYQPNHNSTNYSRIQAAPAHSQQFSPRNSTGQRPYKYNSSNHQNGFYRSNMTHSQDFRSNPLVQHRKQDSNGPRVEPPITKSPSIEISKPKTQVQEDSSLCFTKNGATLSFEKKERETKPQKALSTEIKIERASRSAVKLFDKDYNYQDFLKAWNEFDEKQDLSTDNFTIKSKGYVILKNYVLESENNQSKRSKPKARAPFTSTPSATLVVLDSERFTSSQLQKNIGEWDETSDQAFIMAINQSLNSLNNNNMDESLAQIQQQCSITSKSDPKPPAEKNMTVKERNNFVVRTLVDKATKEIAYAPLYARFATKFPQDFLTEILELNHATINNCIMNTESSGSLICIGSATFFVALANEKLIVGNDLFKVLSNLINEMSERSHPFLIEMFNSFYMNAGQEVADGIEQEYPELWDTIKEVKEKPDLGKRLYFMLVDTEERREKWLNKSQKDDDTSNVQNQQSNQGQSSKENIATVRSAFSEFLSNYDDGGIEVPQINLSPHDFLYAALDVFPEVTKTFFPFIEFISITLENKRASENGNHFILLNRVDRYKELNIDGDAPNIWRNMSILIDNMILRNELSIPNAADVHSHYPEPNQWSFENSIKWYLNDYHDFRDPIFVHSTGLSLEISDALTMPDKVKNNRNNFSMSKLMCIALIRSLNQKMTNYGKPQLRAFDKYKDQLSLAAERYPELFQSEMDYLLQSLEMPKTVDEVINYCKNK